MANCSLVLYPVSQFLNKIPERLEISKNYIAPTTVATFKCKRSNQQFPGFYALRHPENTQQVISRQQISSGRYHHRN